MDGLLLDCVGLFIVEKPVSWRPEFQTRRSVCKYIGLQSSCSSCGLECAVYIEVSLIVILFCLRMAMGMALDTNFQARHCAKLSCPSKT